MPLNVIARMTHAWCNSFPVPIAIALLTCAACARVTLLRPEDRATLHIGETVALRVPTTYSAIGGAGGALLLRKKNVRRDGIVYVYRAVRPGNQTFVAAPQTQTGECVSCVTVHWFVTVIQ